MYGVKVAESKKHMWFGDFFDSSLDLWFSLFPVCKFASWTDYL